MWIVDRARVSACSAFIGLGPILSVLENGWHSAPWDSVSTAESTAALDLSQEQLGGSFSSAVHLVREGTLAFLGYWPEVPPFTELKATTSPGSDYWLHCGRSLELILEARVRWLPNTPLLPVAREWVNGRVDQIVTFHRQDMGRLSLVDRARSESLALQALSSVSLQGDQDSGVVALTEAFARTNDVIASLLKEVSDSPERGDGAIGAKSRVALHAISWRVVGVAGIAGDNEKWRALTEETWASSRNTLMAIDLSLLGPEDVLHVAALAHIVDGHFVSDIQPPEVATSTFDTRRVVEKLALTRLAPEAVKRDLQALMGSKDWNALSSPLVWSEVLNHPGAGSLWQGGKGLSALPRVMYELTKQLLPPVEEASYYRARVDIGLQVLSLLNASLGTSGRQVAPVRTK